MDGVSEKIAYLKGLKEGLGVTDEKTSKLFDAIIDVLESISERIDIDEEITDELTDEVDRLSDEIDDVNAVVDVMFENSCCDFDCDNCDCEDCDCEDCDCDCDDDDDDDDDDVIFMYCSNCKENVCVDIASFCNDDEVVCPTCGKKLLS